MAKLQPHDTLGMRLGIILTELFSVRAVKIDTLAVEFNVSERTIQRDLNERLMYLPINHNAGRYALDAEFLSGLTNNRVKQQ